MSSLVKVALGLAAAALTLLPAHAGHAQGVDEFGGYGKPRAGRGPESGQEAAFEVRVGRYIPEVDSQLNGAPFQNTFHNDNRYFVGAELDWQLIRIKHLGSLAPGIGWGMTKFAAHPQFADKSAFSSSLTRLTIMPMYLVGVLRADVFMKDFRIPLVPYAKLGVGYALWWSSDGPRTATFKEADGTISKGRGASYGLTYALGAMFLLDVLDPDGAKTADGLVGINNSYIFAEWFRPQLDGFGNNKVMDVGSSSWVLGLALEI